MPFALAVITFSMFTGCVLRGSKAKRKKEKKAVFKKKKIHFDGKKVFAYNALIIPRPKMINFVKNFISSRLVERSRENLFSVGSRYRLPYRFY